jgi:hypothetical protein
MGQIDSIVKKGKTILEKGISPIKEGKKNFGNPLFHIEQLAKERMNICKSCEYFQKEPIDFLRIKDERIPELDSMYCEDCGCELPYKLRQNIEKCKKWQK